MKKLKPLKDRLTPAMLLRLQERKITNAQAAEQLCVSETYLSRVVAAMQDKVPGTTTAERAARSKLYQARRQTRADLAKKVKSGELTLAAAVRRAKCSERTMERHIAAYSEPRRPGRKRA